MAARSVSNSVRLMVLSQANKEHNQHYPPRVFEAHYQLASDWLKNELIKQYPGTQQVIDLLMPHMDVQFSKVVGGKISLPKEYRNLLGFGFYVTDLDSCKPIKFKFEDPDNPTADELVEQTAEIQNETKSLDMITQDQWNYYSKHPFKKPKLDSAKGCIFENNKVKVMPYDIPYVETRSIKKTNEYKFGYKMMPDETFVFDPDTTVEELWNENAIEFLFKAVNLLFANYIRDDAYIASAKDIRENNLF